MRFESPDLQKRDTDAHLIRPSRLLGKVTVQLTSDDEHSWPFQRYVAYTGKDSPDSTMNLHPTQSHYSDTVPTIDYLIFVMMRDYQA